MVLGAAVVALTSAWMAPANAGKPGSTALYIPPTNMVVECGGLTRLVGNVPPKTKYVFYKFYKPDSYYNLKSYGTTTYDAFFGFESGPGGAAPEWIYSTEAGGVPISTNTGATYVWAEALSRLGAKPLAWGFATCFGNTAIPIVVNSGNTNLLYTNGSFTVIN
jgi:hypothetical protein